MPQDDEAAARDRVATLIRADIERGVYPPGARLPSYRRLAELFSVAPNTAGAAVGLLRQAGWLTSAATAAHMCGTGRTRLRPPT